MELVRSNAVLPMPAPRDRAALFKTLVRSLCQDALAALESLNGLGPLTPEQLQRLGLVHHYLSYLRRLCDGDV